MRLPRPFQRAVDYLWPLPRGGGARRSRGRVIGGKWSVDEYEARLTSGIYAMAAFLARGFAQATFEAEQWRGGEWVRADLTEWEMIKERPNALNAMSDLLVAAAVDVAAHGVGYIEMVAPPTGRVRNIYWCPAALTTVQYEMGGTDVREYRTGGRPNAGTRSVLPDAMIRIQRGIDIDSPAEGMSPLAVLGDAVGADQQLMRTLNAALHNAAKGTLLMPINDSGQWQQHEVDAMAETLREQSTMDNYGKAGASPHRFDVANIGRDHRAGPLAEAQMLAESRIAAAFGVPVQVVALYTGRLNRSAADLEAARLVAFENVLLPIGNEVSDGLTRHLLPRIGVGSDWRIVADWRKNPVAEQERRQHVEMMLKLKAADVVSAQQVAEAAGVEYGGGDG